MAWLVSKNASPMPKMEGIEVRKMMHRFTGDIYIKPWQFTKAVGTSPDSVSKELGAYLMANSPVPITFEIVNSHLNITFKVDDDSDLLNNHENVKATNIKNMMNSKNTSHA